jgi:hypothetical protein
MRKKSKCLLSILVLSAVAFAGLFIWDAPRYRIELLLEKGAIEKAAKAYFNSEVERNYKQVYVYLAPSSLYRQTHGYQEFVREAEKSPVIIQTYRIVDIYRLRDNDNRKDYPHVDKFVQVEVDVDINFKDSGAKRTSNYCFTFLKEKGTWYKG